MKCKAICKTRKRCSFDAVIDGFCLRHFLKSRDNNQHTGGWYIRSKNKRPKIVK